MVHAIGIHEQTGLNLAERILSGEVGIENRFELTDGGKNAITVSGVLLHAFVKTISRNKLEKLLEDVKVIHCRASYVYIEVVSALKIPQEQTLSPKLLQDNSGL